MTDHPKPIARYDVGLYGNGGPDVSILLERNGQSVAYFYTEQEAQLVADAMNESAAKDARIAELEIERDHNFKTRLIAEEELFNRNAELNNLVAAIQVKAEEWKAKAAEYETKETKLRAQEKFDESLVAGTLAGSLRIDARELLALLEKKP